MIRINSKNNEDAIVDSQIAKNSPIKIDGDTCAFLTECPNLINQFLMVRNDVYVNENGYNHKKWMQDSALRGEKVVVVTKKDKVVGGAKISFSSSGDLLTDEYKDTEFLYVNLLKQRNLEGAMNYCQIDDLILVKEMRNGLSVSKIASLCVNEALKNGCNYIFFVASLPQCRLYKSYFKEAGCKSVEIFKEITWKKVPEYNYSEDHPALVII